MAARGNGYAIDGEDGAAAAKESKETDENEAEARELHHDQDQQELES